MSKEVDIKELKDFLDWIGCDLYFKAQPYHRSGTTIVINTIDDSMLMKWVGDYNKLLSDNNSSKD
tara:strand:- start:791 stop:985 length:195 start_codon:yes stop_codon:yes gene_type:complete